MIVFSVPRTLLGLSSCATRAQQRRNFLEQEGKNEELTTKQHCQICLSAQEIIEPLSIGALRFESTICQLHGGIEDKDADRLFFQKRRIQGETLLCQTWKRNGWY